MCPMTCMNDQCLKGALSTLISICTYFLQKDLPAQGVLKVKQGHNSESLAIRETTLSCLDNRLDFAFFKTNDHGI